MPKPQVKVYNPKGRYGYASLKSATRDVKRGRAFWRADGSVEFIDAVVPAFEVLSCCPVRPNPKLMWPAPLKAQQIEAPPVISDSMMAQTFLAYPQKSRDSYSAAFPALALDNAGLG
jgi:hypothetical protein